MTLERPRLLEGESGRTFLSVCDGLGCASLAFSPLGWRQVLSSEIEGAPRAVLSHRLGAHDMRLSGAGRLPLWGDMAALRVRHMRRFGVELPDVLCGGTPCQGFSVAGLRGGFEDPRALLTLAFIRLANALDTARHHDGRQPIVVFWENVPGILSMEGNPFGHVLAGLVGEDTPIDPVRGKWTDAGLAIGPRRAAAWRILDAQYRGLAQRRERLFVVASARDGFDPAAVLFEPEGLRRHSPPSREAGAGVAGFLTGGASDGGGWRIGPDEAAASHVVPVAFGGNDTRGPIDVATCLSSHGGPHGRQDFESETFVTQPLTYSIMPQNSSRDYKAREVNVAQPLMAGGPVGGNQGGDYVLQPVAFALRGREDGAVPEVEGDGSAVGALRAASGGSSRDYVAFDTTQITSKANRSNPKPGDPCHPLAAGAHAPAIAEATYGVRRLTPTECERLQGVPDGYTQVPYRGKPMADGPRYKMLGNGWAVPVISWIGERIEAELSLSALHPQERAA